MYAYRIVHSTYGNMYVCAQPVLCYVYRVCVYVRGYIPRCYPETESGCASSNGTLVYRLTVVRSANIYTNMDIYAQIYIYTNWTYHVIVNVVSILTTTLTLVLKTTIRLFSISSNMSFISEEKVKLI